MRDLTPGIPYDGNGRRIATWAADGRTKVEVYTQSGQLGFAVDSAKGGGSSFVYLAGQRIAEDHWQCSTDTHTVTYFHTDALGSPVATTDASGTVLERTYYAPYGEALNRTVDGPGYTGHVMDAATGLVYAQQRYYDPVVGRFLSIDPVAADPSSGGNFNRYWYANNNPYKFTDPDGRQATGSRLENSGIRGDLVHSDRPDSTLRVQESRKSLVVTLDDVQDSQMRGAEGGFDLGEIAMQKALISLGEPVNLSKEFIVDTVPDFAICASICAAKAFIGEDVVDVVVNLHEKAVLEGAKKGFADAGVKIGTRAVRAFNEIENTANSIRTAVCTATECL